MHSRVTGSGLGVGGRWLAGSVHHPRRQRRGGPRSCLMTGSAASAIVVSGTFIRPRAHHHQRHPAGPATGIHGCSTSCETACPLGGEEGLNVEADVDLVADDEILAPSAA